MTKRRARLNDDNDPLSSTDKVLAGFEQISKSASQQDEVSTSQQSKSEHTFEASTSQQNNTPIIQLNSNSTSQKANLLTSQQVNLEKVSLRKSTFQISEEVLHQLDKLHLTLQLELGKANAPYKEVIVEEALVQLLESFNSDRAALIEVLMSRQKSRDKL
jgi:hypothetical protein